MRISPVRVAVFSKPKINPQSFNGIFKPTGKYRHYIYQPFQDETALEIERNVNSFKKECTSGMHGTPHYPEITMAEHLPITKEDYIIS